MRILLVDADSQKNFPNLALMKLSAWYKQQDAHVELIKGIPDHLPLYQYDKAFVSCLFFQNKEKVLNYCEQLPFPVQVGGSGVNLQTELSNDIEHILPDYSLYDIDRSLGFTSRGCIRKCAFCVVREKEGLIKDHAPITEFLHPEHNKLILLDNNFLASPRCKENFEYLIAHKIKVNFNQGLDIRLVNEENAKLLKETKYSTWKFNTKRVSFAYDSPKHKNIVNKGVQILKDAGISTRSLMFYVLVGYNSTFEEDMGRIDHLLELGIDPYIMRYNQTKGENRLLMHLSRWVNWRIYRSCTFYEYDYSDSKQVVSEYLARGCPQGAFRGA